MIDEPAPTEDSAGIELVGTAETAKTAESKALQARADGEARCRRNMAPENDAGRSHTRGQTHERARDAAWQPDSTEAKRCLGPLPLSQENTREGEGVQHSAATRPKRVHACREHG